MLEKRQRGDDERLADEEDRADAVGGDPPADENQKARRDPREGAVPLDLATQHGTLSFISTTTIFGTALEISLSEIAIESFFPADRATAIAMRQ
jgi:hypothetical protein